MNFKETLAEKTVHAEDILTKYLPEEKASGCLAGTLQLWSLLWRRWK